MEIRTRKVIRRYVSSDSARTCTRPRVYDHGEYYYRRYDQRQRSEESHPPSYRIIETREPLKPRRGLNTLWRRDPSPIRSQPFKMRLPFIKRVEPAKKDDCELITRGRTRSPRLFVVDPPEIRYAWPREERGRSLEIRCISPKRRPSPRPILKESTVEVEESQREARSRERLNIPRQPRERTPVVEREPVRRRRQDDIEIHQSPERRRQRSGSSGRRQVRFADDIEYVGQRSRSQSQSRERPAHRQSESDDDDIYDRIRRRYLDSRDPEIVYNRPRYRDPSPEGPVYRMSSPPRLRRETLRRETLVSSGRTRPRPRIIQDGESDLSEAGDRIYAEARRRRSQVHDLISNSSSQWRRRFDNMLDFSSEDESYLRGSGSRRYSWRWR